MRKPPSKQRLDQRLLDEGLAESRSRASALIMAGAVLVDGRIVDKPGTRVSTEAEITLKGTPLPFVSRGGLKLQAALDHFGIDVSGLTALDIGCSTGGFTDCLLQRGAQRVYALDVGQGVLHWRLRHDPRVIVREGINARHLDPALLDEPVDLVTVDVSFISLTLILPRIPPVLKPSGMVLALVKPQFEAGRKEVGKGGVVRDAAAQARAVERVAQAGAAMGFQLRGEVPAAIKGPKGNQEYFLYFSLSKDIIGKRIKS